MSLPNNSIKHLAVKNTSGGTDTYNIVPDTLQSNGFTITTPPITADDSVVVNSQLASATVKAANTATNVNGGRITDSIIDLHPESSFTLLPYVVNDLAFLTQRGYSCVMKNITLGTQLYSNSSMASCFDGSPSYLGFSVSAVTDVVQIIIKHEKFEWSQYNYIGFGNFYWAAKSITWESGYSQKHTGTASSPDSDITWKTVGTITGSTSPIYNCSGGSDYDEQTSCNYTRITLTDFNCTSPRIAQIGKLAYDSSLFHNIFVPRSGGTFYGNIAAHAFRPTATTNYSIYEDEFSSLGITYEKTYIKTPAINARNNVVSMGKLGENVAALDTSQINKLQSYVFPAAGGTFAMQDWTNSTILGAMSYDSASKTLKLGS